MKLEIYTDASIRTFNNRTFGCSGAICPITGNSMYTINPDTTNNKSELLAIFNGVKLAYGLTWDLPEEHEIHIYSDSQFAIFGLTKWIYGWLRNRDKNGVMYGSNKLPVKNQELFAMILTFMVKNNLKIHFHHQSGHVNYASEKSLTEANEVFYKSNGYYLAREDIYKISYYNDIVDKASRAKLDNIDVNEFPVFQNNVEMLRYKIPYGFNKFILSS
jgi:ribonuclease HI